MKEQVLRILNMVKEGKLSPEDAYDLMNAFVDFENEPPRTESMESTEEQPQEKKREEEPFRKFVDVIEKFSKETANAVNWQDVAQTIKSAARRGVTEIKTAIEHLGKTDLGAWFSQHESVSAELPINVSAGKVVRLNYANADIKIEGAQPTPTLMVTAKVRGGNKENGEATTVWSPVVQEDESGISINQGRETLFEDVVLKLPADVHLDIQISNGDLKVTDTMGNMKADVKSGDINAKGLKGEVEISCLAGDVTLEHVPMGDVKIESRAGDVRLKHVRTPIKIKSSSGDVRLSNVSSGDVHIEAVAGDVDVEYDQSLTGNLYIKSVTGDVLVDILAGSHGKVLLNAVNGDVRSNLPLLEEKRTRNHVEGVLGNGDGSISVSSVTGDISVNMVESDA